MKKQLRLALSIFLSVCLVVTSAPTYGIAEELEGTGGADCSAGQVEVLTTQDSDSSDYVENPTYTLTSLDGETLSTKAEGRPKILVFVNATGCYNSSSVVQTLSNDMPPNTDVYVIAFSDFTADEVSSFAKSYGNDQMKFAANGSQVGWTYIQNYLQTNRVTTPVIMYIDANNHLQGASQGYLSQTQLRQNLIEFCDVTYTSQITTNVTFEATGQQTSARSMLKMINDFRTNANEAWYWNSDDTTKTTCSDLSELTYDYGLEKLAMQRAAELVLSYSHTRPNDSAFYSAFSDFGYPRGWAGENIALGQESAEEVFTDWQETDENYDGQGHRRNMLNENFAYVGFACVELDGVKYWVQEFGSEPTGEASTPANDSSLQATVEVLNSDASFSSVEANPESLSLQQGESVEVPTVTAQVSMWNTFEGSVFVTVEADWTSANEGVARVDGSKVVATGLGSTTLEAKACGTTVSVPVEVSQGLDGAVVSVAAQGLVYDGSPKEPQVTVVREGATLVEGTDYSVTYSNNVNAGEATVRVTGLGNYRGVATATFTIAPASIEDASVLAQKASWTGSAVTPTVTVTLGQKTLQAGVDYDVQSQGNVEPGTATAAIVGKGNYTGTVSFEFEILDVVPMYRLYNQWSGEHLFTTDASEYASLAALGWNQEGVAWHCPRQSEHPVYRLYNPWSGDHFYTGDVNEYKQLGDLGWSQEGVAFFSADRNDDGAVPIYRLFNQWLTAGTHLFTTDAAEYARLCGLGWSGEGVAFYGVAV